MTTAEVRHPFYVVIVNKAPGRPPEEFTASLRDHPEDYDAAVAAAQLAARAQGNTYAYRVQHDHGQGERHTVATFYAPCRDLTAALRRSLDAAEHPPRRYGPLPRTAAQIRAARLRASGIDPS